MENIETLLAAVAQTQGFDDDPVVARAPSAKVGSSDSRSGSSFGAPPSGEVSGNVQPCSVAVGTPQVGGIAAIGGGVKRKRGRPPKGQMAAKLPPLKREKLEDEEEDVCFICFDGGSLVLCDRKGCPKAYHPACIKRDEEFFNSKAKWNCGWHICSVCMKASHYMCYTCTFSLCKRCTKNSDYVCVRGNKGFCSTCMKTIMLIENKDPSVQVDFDDKTSWEYLFKVYWVILKEKLSLTFTELIQAKPPVKVVPAYKWQPNNVHATLDVKVPISSIKTEPLELNTARVETSLLQNNGLRMASSSTDNHVDKLHCNYAEGAHSHSNDIVKSNLGKVIDEPEVEKGQDKPNIAETRDKQLTSKNTDKEPSKLGTDGGTEWVSKDLLEFIAFVRNGDTSAMSQFDVQTLLLDYIKRNNLWDSHQKGQVICDQRLRNIFKKSLVGYIEMIKLLEYHFPVKEEVSQNNSIFPGDLKADGNVNSLPTPINGRKRKTQEKNEERVPQNNLTEYAAIDVHNINLIYVRRNLVESLLEDQENFNNKVIGSIVRIRTSSFDQKLDIYRLGQVVGTIKVAKPYKIGERTANVMLQVLNLDEKEIVSIDTISNEEFTERTPQRLKMYYRTFAQLQDECRRLRKSIRCGLVKQLTVDEVRKVAMALQPVKINNWLEAEILQLSKLRDRANVNGCKKELREYLERLQLLKSPEERHRRIAGVPEIHADPKMSLNYYYESEEEDKTCGKDCNKVELVRASYLELPRNGRNSTSPNKRGKEDQPIISQNRTARKKDANGTQSSGKPVNVTNSEVSGRNDHAVQRTGLVTSTPTAAVEKSLSADNIETEKLNVANSEVGVENDQAVQRTGLETLTTTASVENLPSPNDIETEKIWHYRDPNGKIQGPISMMQLRIWNTTGLLLPDMRIWTDHEQYDSVLLTDALVGHLHGGPESSCKLSSGSRENQASGGIGESEGTNETGEYSKQTEASTSNHVSLLSENNSGLVKENASDVSSWPQCWDLLNDKNSSADDVHVRNLLPSSSCGQTNAAQPERSPECGESNHGSQNGEKNSNEPTQDEKSSGNELQNQCNKEDQATPPNEENLRSQDVDLSSNVMESESAVAPVSNSLDLNKQIGNIDLSDLHNSSPINAENQPSVDGMLELLDPAPRSNNEDAIVTKPSGGLNFPVLDSGPSWCGASSPVASGVQIPDVANEWCGYSPAPVKPSVQEWDSGLASAPLLKPDGMNEYVATSISDDHQISQAPPPPQPASNMPNWLAMLNEPIEFDVMGEESVSDLLAEVDAMESQGAVYSPNSAIKFAREFLEECKDDCFSSIEDFNPTPDPQRCDASGSTGDMQMTSQSSCNPIETFDALDSFRKSSVNSSASSEGGTNAQFYSGDAGSEFHPPAPNNPNQEMVGHATTATSSGSDPVDPGWGSVQGNINLVTVQGNVNLVLGPGQGMANLGWGTNPGTGPAWVNPSMNQSPRNGSLHLPWDNQQRKFAGERFTSPRASYQGNEPGFIRGRPPRGRQAYNGGGGFSRALPKGQRVCKFYESGHCKKGAFCDYLHP